MRWRASLWDGKAAPTCLNFFEAVKDRFSRRGFRVRVLRIFRNGKKRGLRRGFWQGCSILLGFRRCEILRWVGVVCCKIAAWLADFASHGQETKTFETAPSQKVKVAVGGRWFSFGRRLRNLSHPKNAADSAKNSGAKPVHLNLGTGGNCFRAICRLGKLPGMPSVRF